MYKNYFIIFSLIAITFLSGCLGNNDSKTIFSSYGVIEESATGSVKIRTDNNRLLTVTNIEAFNPLPKIGLRILARYTTDADTSLQNYPVTIEAPYSSYIQTTRILSSADTTTTDSIGKNPILVEQAWFGGGFLNLGTILGHASTSQRLQYNIVKKTENTDTLYLTLLANDFVGTFFDRKYGTILSVNIDSLLIGNQEEIIVSIGGNREVDIPVKPIRWEGTYFRAKKYEVVLLEKANK